MNIAIKGIFIKYKGGDPINSMSKLLEVFLSVMVTLTGFKVFNIALVIISKKMEQY